MNTPRTIKLLILAASHVFAAAVGFAAGIYALPILIAPAGPSAADVAARTGKAMYTGTFRRDLKDSDLLHWGEGKVSIAADVITFAGKLAPGPDYKLYLSPEFVETEVDFARVKAKMTRVGDVKTFDNFVVAVPGPVDVARFNTVIVWCETFGQFITAAQYR
jgi:Electron transfer DM13